MHDALIVRRGQTFGALHADRHKFRHADRCPHPFPQRLPLDILHDEKNLSLLFDHVVDGSDVGVIEGGGALRFLQKSFAVTLIELEPRRHPLDGNDSLQDGVLRPIDVPHATGADPVLHQESAHPASCQVVNHGRSFDAVARIRHGTEKLPELRHNSNAVEHKAKADFGASGLTISGGRVSKDLRYR